MEPKLLGKWQDQAGDRKIEMHFKHFLVPKSKGTPKNDRGVLKGYRSQLEGA